MKESDTVRFLFLARFFLEFFLLVYKDERAKGIDLESEEAHGFDLVAEMMEVQSVGFVTGRMKKALEEKVRHGSLRSGFFERVRLDLMRALFGRGEFSPYFGWNFMLVWIASSRL